MPPFPCRFRAEHGVTMPVKVAPAKRPNSTNTLRFAGERRLMSTSTPTMNHRCARHRPRRTWPIHERPESEWSAPAPNSTLYDNNQSCSVGNGGSRKRSDVATARKTMSVAMPIRLAMSHSSRWSRNFMVVPWVSKCNSFILAKAGIHFCNVKTFPTRADQVYSSTFRGNDGGDHSLSRIETRFPCRST